MEATDHGLLFVNAGFSSASEGERVMVERRESRRGGLLTVVALQGGDASFTEVRTRDCG
jgi:hypothetical protein